MKYQIIGLLALTVFFFSCEKNKLTEGQEKLIGKYNWTSTGTSDGSIWTNNEPPIYDSMTTYSAAFELDNSGQIFLFQNDVVICQSSYTILEKEAYDEHSAYIYIKMKNTSGINLSDGKLKIRMSLDTLVTVDRFPFPAIDNATNYFSGYTSVNNNFVPE